MLLDIRPDYLQIVQDILQKHVPQYEVWAFGSRAKWTAKEYSDLDLCVVSDKPLSFSVLGAMGEDFSESDLPWKVDVVDWATTSTSFRKIIERDKVVVQIRGEGLGAQTEWQSYKLGDAAEILTGFSFKGEQYLKAGAGIRVVRGDNVTEGILRWGEKEKCWSTITPELENYRLNLGDIVIGMDGSKIGKNFAEVSESDNVCLLAQRVARLRAKPVVLQKFLRYAVCNTKFTDYVQTIKTGTSIPHISKRQIADFGILAPSLKTQEKIATLLSALDDKISLLRETNATLEAIAQALFKSWFVNFDPVRAKAEGIEPEGISPEIAALFPSEFEDSVLGEIPKGWQAMPLADACEINPTRRITKGKQAPYLEMSALPTRGHRTDTPIPRAFSSGTKFINGDTLLARITPCLENGKTAFVDCLLEDEVGWGSTEYIVLRPKAPLPNYWAYLLSRHEHFRQYAIQAMVGTSGRQRVEVSRLAQYLVAIPDAQVSATFAELVEPIQRSIAANDDAAKSLAALRDTLLPRLMSGKLLVPSDTMPEEEAA